MQSKGCVRIEHSTIIIICLYGAKLRTGYKHGYSPKKEVLHANITHVWQTAYLNLLTDLDELCHLVLQFTVSLHKVGEVVLQGLLLREKSREDKEGPGAEKEYKETRQTISRDIGV